MTKKEVLLEEYDHLVNNPFYQATVNENWDEVIKLAKRLKKIEEMLSKLD